MTAPGWYPDPAGGPGQRYFDGTQWTDRFAATPPVGQPARRGMATNKKVAISLSAGFAVLVVGIVVAEALRGAPPKTVPLTPDQEFNASIIGIPMNADDPELVARSVCLAFKRTPGTKLDSATRQMAAREGWTVDQAREFIAAATKRYCPEYRFGS